ncbi:MAG: LPS export ABC transporter periplasmic protein LptC [Bacteroidales bacterium]|nr:LPS export ABC transporter periplasmic protein LptC [Bacteroidales bacterium]
MIATALAVAFVVFSCKGKPEGELLDLTAVPLQTIDDMFFVMSTNGGLQMRGEAEVMEVYQNDTCSYELFPKGLNVFGYAENGELESTIQSDGAKHHKSKNDEYWLCYGNVVIKNIIKQETMETDTLYWDQSTHEIYTDCYIRMYSPSGFMQGYGMRSDEHARNADIMRPFNSYGVVVKDTTNVEIDTINIIGPILK